MGRGPSFETWCAQACAEIAFGFDREEVADELRGHYEDARDALLEAGMAEEDARELAVRGMGDAAEVAHELAAVHNSFWTVLWLVSRWLARLALLCALLYGLLSLGAARTVYHDKGVSAEQWGQVCGAALHECGAAGETLGYRWEVARWARTEDALAFDLVLRGGGLAAGSINPGLARLRLADDRGQAYTYTDAVFQTTRDNGVGPGQFYTGDERRWYTRYTYTLIAEGVPPDAAWVELRVENTDFALRIDLTEGDGEP